MKKIGIAVISALLLYSIPVYSQTIKVKSLRGDNRIDSVKKLKFDDEKIVLDNVTVKCGEIEFTAAVKKIKLIGSSTLICDTVNLASSPKAIEIVTSGGQLLIEYSDSYVDAREFLIDKSRGVTITIRHKPRKK